MHGLRNSRSSLFLMELIIVILFFSIGSAVCIQAFVKAHLLSQSAQDLSFASSTVSSAASALQYTDGSPEEVEAYFPALQQDGKNLVVYYNAHYDACPLSDAVYTLYMQTQQEELACTSHIWMTDEKDSVIYELTIRYPAFSYRQSRGEAHG